VVFGFQDLIVVGLKGGLTALVWVIWFWCFYEHRFVKLSGFRFFGGSCEFRVIWF